MDDNVMNLNENLETLPYVISLLDFLRALPSVFDPYLVTVTAHSWKKCSVCYESRYVKNKEYSVCVPLLFFRRTVQNSSCIFAHLEHPDFYNHLLYEFTVRIEKQVILIDYYDYDDECVDFVCRECGSGD